MWSVSRDGVGAVHGAESAGSSRNSNCGSEAKTWKHKDRQVEAKAEEQISVVDFLFVSLFVPKVLVLLIPTEVLTENIWLQGFRKHNSRKTILGLFKTHAGFED